MKFDAKDVYFGYGIKYDKKKPGDTFNDKLTRDKELSAFVREPVLGDTYIKIGGIFKKKYHDIHAPLSKGDRLYVNTLGLKLLCCEFRGLTKRVSRSKVLGLVALKQYQIDKGKIV